MKERLLLKNKGKVCGGLSLVHTSSSIKEMIFLQGILSYVDVLR